MTPSTVPAQACGPQSLGLAGRTTVSTASTGLRGSTSSMVTTAHHGTAAAALALSFATHDAPDRRVRGGLLETLPATTWRPAARRKN